VRHLKTKLSVILLRNPPEHDDDPFDHLFADYDGGILLRTDFTDENAWGIFLERFTKAKSEIEEATKDDSNMDEDTPDQSTRGPADSATKEDEDDSSDDETTGIESLIAVINPTLPDERAVFNGISNLSALRLLNDVDIRPAPQPAAGTRRITPPNRLVDQNGWQEIYTGLTIWIYDAKSNVDGSVKLVSQAGDVYGTAT
jgi:hypothetical protein